MKKTTIGLSLTAFLLLATQSVVLSHCEIPCGIYGDKMRIAMFYEDIATVEKSMKQIEELMATEDKPNANQVVRWVMNKEEHANKIQHIATQYFLTQRIKAKEPGDGEAYRKYVKQLTILHGIIVHAMKAKQTTDTAHTARLRELVDDLAESYFSAEDLEHLREEHAK